MTARRSTLDRARDDLAAAKKRQEKDRGRTERTFKEHQVAKDALTASSREVEALEAYVAALTPAKDERPTTTLPGPSTTT